MTARQQGFVRNLARIAELAEQRKVKVLVDERNFSFEEVAAAYEYAGSGPGRGEVVIVR